MIQRNNSNSTRSQPILSSQVRLSTSFICPARKTDAFFLSKIWKSANSDNLISVSIDRNPRSWNSQICVLSRVWFFGWWREVRPRGYRKSTDHREKGRGWLLGRLEVLRRPRSVKILMRCWTCRGIRPIRKSRPRIGNSLSSKFLSWFFFFCNASRIGSWVLID